MYDKANKEILNKFSLAMRTYSTSSTDSSSTNYMLFNTSIPNNYSYFKITSVSCNNYVNTNNGGYVTYGDNKGNYVVLSTNTEYSLKDYTNMWTVVKSTTNGQTAYCDVKVTFYNK